MSVVGEAPGGTDEQDARHHRDLTLLLPGSLYAKCADHWECDVQKFLIPAGGILAGSGMMTMLFGWTGPDGVDIAAQISTVGFSAVSDISITSAGYAAFAMIFGGIALMVFGNKTAWQETGGY